jgi:hypothetical protein
MHNRYQVKGFRLARLEHSKVVVVIGGIFQAWAFETLRIAGRPGRYAGSVRYASLGRFGTLEHSVKKRTWTKEPFLSGQTSAKK